MRYAIYIILFLLIWVQTAEAQHKGVVSTTTSRMAPFKALRKSVAPFRILMTDVNNEVTYWQKDTVFVLFKANVDSIINHYNDTVQKGGIPCRDSMWRTGNTIFHKNTMCNTQSIGLPSDYLFTNLGTGSKVLKDTLNRIIKYRTLVGNGTISVYEQGDEIIIESDSTDGCKGGRVYQYASISDTTGLNPNPNCGDIFVATADTCFDYLYLRGHTPAKWNFIGQYLKNVNCSNGAVHWNVGDGLGKSVKLSGVQDADNSKFRSVKGAGLISVKTVGDNIVVSDSLGNLYIFENVGDGAFIIKDTTNKTIKIRSIKGLGCLKATVNGDVIEVQDTCLNATGVDYSFINVGGKAEVLKDTLNRIIKYRTIEGLNGIKVVQETDKITIEDTTQVASDYKFRQDGTGVPVLKDTLNRLIKYYAVKGSGTVKVTLVGNDIIVSDTFFHADTLQKLNTINSTNVSFKVELDKDKTTNFEILAGVGLYFDNNQTGDVGIVRVNVDTTTNAFKKNNYDVANVGTGAGIYRDQTGFDPKTFNLRRIQSHDNSITVTENADDIDLEANVNNRDSIWHNASTSQLERKDYAKGTYIGGTTFTAGDGIEFASPVSGNSAHIEIKAVDNQGCTALANGFWTGYLVMYDPLTNCMEKYACNNDPCADPPPLPPTAIVTDTLLSYPTENYTDGMQLFSYKAGAPSGYIGYDFGIPTDFPPATNATDLGYFGVNLNNVFYQVSASPVIPIVGNNQTTIQAHLNASLVAAGFNANDLIWIVNNDNTVTIWRNPSYTPIGDEFLCGDLTPNNWTNKYYPTMPTTHNNIGVGVSKVILPTTKSYQQYNVGAISVDISSGANTTTGYRNFTTSDIPFDLSKMDVFVNGVKHNYTVTPSSSTYLSYTLSGTVIEAFSGATPLTINQIEVKINPF